MTNKRIYIYVMAVTLEEFQIFLALLPHIFPISEILLKIPHSALGTLKTHQSRKGRGEY